MKDGVLREFRPSILNYLSGFVAPFGILIFLLVKVLAPYAISVFWVLEICVMLNALFSVYSAKYRVGTDFLEVSYFTKASMQFNKMVMDFGSIQNLYLQQNFIQRIFNIGDLRVETAGRGFCVLTGIEDPDSLIKMILDLKESLKG